MVEKLVKIVDSGGRKKKRKRKKVTGKLMCKLRVDSDSLLRHRPELLCAAVIR